MRSHPPGRVPRADDRQLRACLDQNARDSSHLDAGLFRTVEEISAARGIFSGKGSPSAQTAPSSKCSFFQMGTVFFRVSISQRQVSKAAPRCAEATTISTLV